MIAEFLNTLSDTVFGFLSGLFGIFPQMPVSASDLQQYLVAGNVPTILAWVNYFLPFGIASAIVAVWATAMMAYVGIKLAMKYTGEIL